MDIARPNPSVRLLGDFAVLAGGRALDLGSTRQRLLLGLLTVRRNQVVPADALAELLWGAQQPADVASALQNFVSRVRRVLSARGPAATPICARGHGYVLTADPDDVDVDVFLRLVDCGRTAASTGAYGQAAAALREALALWRGPALAEFADLPAFRAEAARLEDARREATETLADALLDAADPPGAVALLEPFVAAEPYREGACGRLMLALYRQGRQADALGAYRRLRHTLGEDLGLQPGPALRRLEELILRQDPELELLQGPGRIHRRRWERPSPTPARSCSPTSSPARGAGRARRTRWPPTWPGTTHCSGRPCRRAADA